MHANERCTCCCRSASSLVSGILFALMAIVHILRLALGWVWTCNGYDVPMWWSIAGVVVLGLMAIWDLRVYACQKCRNRGDRLPPPHEIER